MQSAGETWATNTNAHAALLLALSPVSPFPQIIYKCLWVFPQIKQIKEAGGVRPGRTGEFEFLLNSFWTMYNGEPGGSGALLLPQRNRHAAASWKPLTGVWG